MDQKCRQLIAYEKDGHQLDQRIEIEPELAPIHPTERSDRMRDGGAAPPRWRREVKHRRRDGRLTTKNAVLGLLLPDYLGGESLHTLAQRGRSLPGGRTI